MTATYASAANSIFIFSPHTRKKTDGYPPVCIHYLACAFFASVADTFDAEIQSTSLFAMLIFKSKKFDSYLACAFFAASAN